MARKTQISKELILRNALEMLIRDGYSSINIKTLSKEIGCSTQPLVWHFGNMEGLRTALAEYALIYANSKIAPAAEDAADAFSQVITAYIQLALREPNLFKFLYMNSDSSASLNENDALKSDNSFGELVKRLSDSYQVSGEKIARYLQHTIIYLHGIATLTVAGIVKASEEEVMQMIDYAEKSFRVKEGIPLEKGEVRIMAEKWLLCPVCGSKTRLKLRQDTKLENFPLFCPKCRQEMLVSVTGFITTRITEPDAKTQSR